jgi:cellulose synthase/poly-beta-1,6-N-acetylglucosamine synthase-like glycosyltransferase
MTPTWHAIFQLVLVRSNWVALDYFLLVNTFYFVLLISAAWGLRQHLLSTRGETRWRVLGSRVAPRISILAAAYNEVAAISESVQSLLTLYYPNLEVVLVNDGSTDETLAVLVKEFELVPIHPIYRYQVKTKPVRGLYLSRTHPNLMVVNKENGGRADALNAGLNVATGKLVCTIDADTLIEADALQRMVRPFLASDRVLGAGGTIRVANASVVKGGRVVEPHAPRRPVPGFQVVEYLRAFLFGRLGWNNLGDNLIISGAFGLFQRQAMVDIGGYESATVAEDLEIVVRLRRHAYEQKTPHRVVFLPDPVAWTEAPESLRVLARQRDRWHRGLAEVLWRHRRLLFNPAYGAMGMVLLPYFVFMELLAPVVEALGLVCLTLGLTVGVVDAPFAFLFFLCAYGYGAILGVFALLLDEMSYRRYEQVGDRLILLGWALLENLGYRQLTVFWRLRGLVKFLGGKTDWGAMERRGFRRPAAHQALASGKHLV